MLTSDIMGAFEFCDFDLDDTTSMDSTPFCSVCMYQRHKTFMCCQRTSVAKFARTRNKQLVDWSTENKKKYYPETVITDK